MSGERVLCVDDEPQLLTALRRVLRGRFELETCDQPLQALELLRSNGPYAVIVSDMRMPGLDGAQLLEQARAIAPDTARVMLTGNADQATAVRAVNEGSIFRFLNKPCSNEEFTATVQSALEFNRRLRAERELLEQTLRGAVGALTEILALVDPEAFGRALRLRDRAGVIAGDLKCARAWEIELAALMLEVGRVTVPTEVRRRQAADERLTTDEERMLAQVPSVGARLLKRIPRLDGVVAILDALTVTQATHGHANEGVRVLGPLLDLAAIEACGKARNEAWSIVRLRVEHDSATLRAMAAWIARTPDDAEHAAPVRKISFHELLPGMVTAGRIETVDGRVLLGAGQLVSHIGLERIRNHAKVSGVREPIAIRTPGRHAHDTAPDQPGEAE